MSHFTVLVIGDDVERQLAPYHEYECTGRDDEYVVFVPAKETMEELQKEFEEYKEKYNYETFEQFMKEWHGYKQEDGVWGRKTNPNAKWDWYQVGGRWSGFLKKKEGVEGLLGSPGVFGNQPKEGGVDIITKGDVDWEGMRNEGLERAKIRYELVWKGIKDTTECKSWDEVKEMFPADIEFESVRDFYHNQERIVSFRKVCSENVNLFGHFSEIDEYLTDEKTYLEREANKSITTYAVVKDSVWFQKGKMGWWGISTDEITQDEWNKKYWEMIQSIPDDTILTLVDCHI